jgi:hypothetical protein
VSNKSPTFKEPNADGSVVVQLGEDVVFRGETFSRVTIPALKGKHLARLTFALSGVPTNAQLIDWCQYVVEPVGVVGEMSPRDALDIAGEAYTLLGKSLATGDSPSES